MAWIADGLTLVRLLVLTPLFIAIAPGGGWAPVVVFALAALSDFVDGPIARRARRVGRYGGALDSMADVVFVLGGTIQAASLGRCSWLVPGSIAASVSAYLLGSVRLSTGAGAPRLSRTRLGHWAGIANYALVGLSVGPGAMASAYWPGVLMIASLAVIGLNVAAVSTRLIR